MQPWQGSTTLFAEEKVLSAISRSASVVLSAQINRQLLAYFSATELLLIVLVMHVLFNSIQSVPGFTAAWNALRELMQSIVIQALANYASTASAPGMSVLHLLAVIEILECLPTLQGWVGQDLDSFTTNVTYIFADQLQAYLLQANIPLLGGVLGICLRGDSLVGKTLAFTGVTTLTACLFSAILGEGELALAWPVMLLYFISEICRTYDFQDFLNFGLFKASDAAFNGLSARGVPPQTIAMGFIFLLTTQPTDTVWTGTCSLVFVQASSVFLLNQINFISNTDPVLAGLCVVTFVYFGALGVHLAAAQTIKR